MKANPLFLDSTKFRGDTVIVEIELSGVELAEGEMLFAHVRRLEGEGLVQLQPKGLKKWSAQARMEYQQTADIEFFITFEGKTIETSDRRKVNASYVIHQKWDRVVVVELAAAMLEDLEAPFDESLINGPTLVENSHGVFEPLLPGTSALPDLDRRLPMIVEIKNPKPFHLSNENLETGDLSLALDDLK